MTSDPGHSIQDRYPDAKVPADIPVNEGTWSAVQNGKHVISSTGARLGKVRDKSEFVFEVEAPHGLLETEELYVPHFAVERVDGDEIRLNMSEHELADAYDHFSRSHLRRPE